MDTTDGQTPEHITIRRADGADDGRAINRTAVGLAAAGGLAAIGAVAALWRWRGQAVAVSKNTVSAAAMPATIPTVTADDGPIAGGSATIRMPSSVNPSMVTAEDGPLATVPVLGTEPRRYTGSGHIDMAVYSEPGNDERPAEQPDAARHARDEGEAIGAFVDA